MSCNSDACDSCEVESGERITLSATPYNMQYLIMDEEVLINQIDLLQQEIPPLCDVIILQSVMVEVRKRNLSVFNQLSNLFRDSGKRFVFFANQNFENTYGTCLDGISCIVDRQMDESIEDYNIRLIVAAANYFNEHFKVALLSLLNCSPTISTQ